jgi:hypothetical protein
MIILVAAWLFLLLQLLFTFSAFIQAIKPNAITAVLKVVGIVS